MSPPPDGLAEGRGWDRSGCEWRASVVARGPDGATGVRAHTTGGDVGWNRASDRSECAMWPRGER